MGILRPFYFFAITPITKKFKNPLILRPEIDRKANYKTAFFFILVAFLLTFLATSFIIYTGSSITGNTVSSDDLKITGTNAIMLPDSNQPLPNTEEGTVSLWTKPPVQMFEQFNDARKYIVFFTAANIPGMRVVYNLEEKVFEAGVPVLKSSRIDIFDNQEHNVVYTYKRGVGQSLFIDSQIVNTSDYVELSVDEVTGFSVFEGETALPEVNVGGVEIAKFCSYVTQEELDFLK
jgi:hypothetical protein